MSFNFYSNILEGSWGTHYSESDSYLDNLYVLLKPIEEYFKNENADDYKIYIYSAIWLDLMENKNL